MAADTCDDRATPDPLPSVLLRPGVRVAVRDADTLQVGRPPGPVVVVPRRYAGPLTALASGTPAVLDLPLRQRLGSAGLLVEARPLLTSLPAADAREAARARDRVVAAFAQHGDAAPAVLAARAGARVDLLPGPEVDLVRALLADAGVDARTGTGPDPSPDLVVVDGGPEPDRDVLDALQSSGTPHLVVARHERGVRVGPFVVPTATACQRCVDAHRRDRDPAYPLVVGQYAAGTAAGWLQPTDPALRTVAAGLVAHDVTAWLAGEEPRTWSSVVEVGPGLDLEAERFLRHPWCSCAWPSLAA